MTCHVAMWELVVSDNSLNSVQPPNESVQAFNISHNQSYFTAAVVAKADLVGHLAVSASYIHSECA